MTGKVLSKIFKVVCAAGIVVHATLKWMNIMPDATVGEICAIWATVYGLGAGTIDANIMIDKFKGVKKDDDENCTDSDCKSCS